MTANGVWMAKHRHNAGTCPGCHGYLWADVTVNTEVRAPGLTHDGKPTANVTARIVRVALEHECAGEADR